MKNMSGNSLLRKQLKHFYNSLLMQDMKKSRCPADWLDAFLLLEQYLESRDTGERLLVFLDELPWLDRVERRFSLEKRCYGLRLIKTICQMICRAGIFR